MTLALAQIFHLGNARSVGPVIAPARAFANRYALAAVAIAIALQAVAIGVGPVASVLHVTAIGRSDYVLIVGLALLPAIAGQAIKLARARP
jgi:hypothetical protein